MKFAIIGKKMFSVLGLITVLASSAQAGLGVSVSDHEYYLSCYGQTSETQGEGLIDIITFGEGQPAQFITNKNLGMFQLNIGRYVNTDAANVYVSVPFHMDKDTAALHKHFADSDVKNISIYNTVSLSTIVAGAKSDMKNLSQITKADLDLGSAIQLQELRFEVDQYGEITSAVVSGTANGQAFSTVASCSL